MIKQGIVAAAIGIAGLQGALAATAYTSENWNDRFFKPTESAFCTSCNGDAETSDTFTLGASTTIGGVDVAVVDWYGSPHNTIEVGIWDMALTTQLFSQTFTLGNYTSTNLGNTVDLLSFSLSGPTLAAGNYRMSWYDPANMGMASYAGSGLTQSHPRIQNLNGYSSIQAGASFQIYDNAGVTPVPEPETYAMMLAGLGLLGVVARRRKQ
jgi:hypothetical protein